MCEILITELSLLNPLALINALHLFMFPQSVSLLGIIWYMEMIINYDIANHIY